MTEENAKKGGTIGTFKSVLMGRFRKLLIFPVFALVGLVAVVLWAFSSASDGLKPTVGTYVVGRGDLTISVTEDGDIVAVNSKDIKSEVEGRTTIISIVDEGTYITPEDVKNGKILVELDSSEIKQKLAQQEISYLNAQASLTEAKESLDIQKKQNESDIEAGKLKVQFALMDLQKYLGEVVANKLVLSRSNQHSDPNKIELLVKDPNLGGEALQKLRELNANIALTEAKLARAEDTLKGTQKLYESNYVAEVELKGDQLDVQSLKFQRDQDKTAMDLFLRYEFPKQAEKLLSDYREAQRELDRVRASARSKLAQAQAQLGSKKATYLVQKERLENLRKQLKACVIRAPSPGEVVYASSTERRSRYGSNEPIDVGLEIRERQKIISIPDTSQMKVEIKVHETWIDKIELGQKAIITVSAFPDKTFTGKVIRKAPLADPANWLNPDLKVYSTDVSIDGTHEFLKTGMTAKVEIIIDKLKDVINVPIQAVANRQGKKVCYVANNQGVTAREVQTGAFNDNFVEIKAGLREGEHILLNPPRAVETASSLGKKQRKKVTTDTVRKRKNPVKKRTRDAAVQPKH